MAKRIEAQRRHRRTTARFKAIDNISMTIEPKTVTALIGPSGCGKSTFLRSINRMHEVLPGARIEGRLTIDDQNIYDRDVDVTAVRRMIGMVFQRPNPFPTMSIYENVVAGLRLNGVRRSRPGRRRREGAARRRTSGTRSRTGSAGPAPACPAASSSGSASPATIAVEPQVVLMDEPCSALDPISTLAIEDLMYRAEGPVHDHHRHAQHAAGGPGLATGPASSRSTRPATRAA